MKKVLITGATGGIGLSFVKEFKDSGYEVIATGTNQEKLDKIRSELDVKTIQASLSNRESVLELIKEVEQTDILIHNAGITKDSLLMKMTDEQWDEVLSINLTAAFLLSRGFIRNMIKNKWGRIIYIGSVVGSTGNPGQVNYCASKAGLVGMTKSLAIEVASKNITVNLIAPGFIETPMTENLSESVRSSFRIPAGRIGIPSDISPTVRFLASDNASYITGQTIHINGGMF
jgi:3-oxoacyl-[acyl-carrier protein] reductase